MEFEFDEDKRRASLAKHGVDFIDMFALFDGPFTQDVDDRRDYGETRFNCAGEINGRVFVVTITWRGAVCRIIHARKANDRETRKYRARVGR
jgi:uncharacterized DUF497 family protein